MAFNSLTYVIFLAAITAVYWTLRRPSQNALLALAGFFFYSWWNWRFVFLLLFTAVFDYSLSLKMHRSQNPRARKLFLCASLTYNLGVLFVFKYSHFFFTAAFHALDIGTPSWLIPAVLPIGISFYTFESVAYMVDIYAGRSRPAGSFLEYAIFISFFPHLVAGPIMRPNGFLAQCERNRRLDRRRFVNGLDYIMWGMLKKIVIADGIGYYVDAIFSLNDPSALLILVGSAAFAIQIFADFSAYTDIARGSAKLLGFELPKNFYRPYLARSIGQFWRRWHVSLSFWVRDYIYIPLGGSRRGPARTVINLLIAWTLCGLWHGAAWTFLLWGAYFGVLLAVERIRPHRSLIGTACAVLLGWSLFRAPTLHAWYRYFSIDSIVRSYFDAKASYVIGAVCVFYSAPWFAKDFWNFYRTKIQMTPKNIWEFRIFSYAACTALILLFAHAHSRSFIYFQF